MSAPLAILCYHRILPEGERHGAGRPYFVRGTAVSEQNFAAQAAAIMEHFVVWSESRVLDWLDDRRPLARPACWITFDDGYRDVIDRAAPILARHGLPATAFVTTAVASGTASLLPADAWYAILSRATKTRGTFRLGDEPPQQIDLERDYERLIDGPEKRRFLEAAPTEQARILESLAGALAAPAEAPPDLYLRAKDLHALTRVGVSIGGHGRTHAILTQVGPEALASEVSGPAHDLMAMGIEARAFAYPDGAGSDIVVDAADRAGWQAAVVLEGRVVRPNDRRLALPRLIPTDDPRWIETNLLAP